MRKSRYATLTSGGPSTAHPFFWYFSMLPVRVTGNVMFFIAWQCVVSRLGCSARRLQLDGHQLKFRGFSIAALAKVHNSKKGLFQGLADTDECCVA